MEMQGEGEGAGDAKGMGRVNFSSYLLGLSNFRRFNKHSFTRL